MASPLLLDGSRVSSSLLIPTELKIRTMAFSLHRILYGKTVSQCMESEGMDLMLPAVASELFTSLHIQMHMHVTSKVSCSLIW
jgi:hypothetical protein